MAQARTLRSRSTSARLALLAAMVVQAVFVLMITRGQWFELDALQYIATRGGDPSRDLGLLEPYGGHWQVLPILAFRALFTVFGATYWPYVAFALAIHFLLCWAAFELLLRLGTHAVVAVCTVWVLLFYGHGSDVFMSDAPFPLSLATLISYAAALLLERLRHSRGALVIAAAMLVAAIMTSGAGIAGTVFVAGLTLVRAGMRKALAATMPAAVVFVTWYATYGHDGGRVRPFGASLLEIPEWIWTGLPGALEQVLGIPGAGVVLLALLGLALVIGKNAPMLRRAAAVGLIAATAQMSLSAIGAIAMGSQTALTGRYNYLTVAFMLPLIALGLTEAWARLRVAKPAPWFGAVAVLALLVPVSIQAVVLQRDQADARRVFSTLFYNWVQGAIVAVEDGERILTPTPDKGFFQSADIGVLTSDRLRQRMTVSDRVDEKTRLDAENTFMVYVGSEDQDMFLPAFVGVSGFDKSGASKAGCSDLDAMLLQDQVVKIATGPTGNQFGMISDSTKVTTRLRRGDLVSSEKTWDVSAGPVFVATTAKDAVLEVIFDAEGRYTLCHQ